MTHEKPIRGKNIESKEANKKRGTIISYNEVTHRGKLRIIYNNKEVDLDFALRNKKVGDELEVELGVKDKKPFIRSILRQSTNKS